MVYTRRKLSYLLLIVLLYAAGGSCSFSADDLMAQEQWVAEWDLPPNPVAHQPEILYGETEVISYMGEGEEPSLWEEMGWVIIAPLIVLGAVFAAVSCYSCYKGECCCCKIFTNCGRKVANTYTPGMKIDKDGKVEYYEMTQEEMEAMENLIETVAGPAS